MQLQIIIFLINKLIHEWRIWECEFLLLISITKSTSHNICTFYSSLDLTRHLYVTGFLAPIVTLTVHDSIGLATNIFLSVKIPQHGLLLWETKRHVKTVSHVEKVILQTFYLWSTCLNPRYPNMKCFCNRHLLISQNNIC